MRRCRAIAFRLALGLLLAQIAAAAAAAEHQTAQLNVLVPFFQTYRPSGAGPFPTLLFVPGCRGFAPRAAPRAYTGVAAAWQARGFAIVFVDYLRARGVTRCGGDLAPADVAADVLAAAAYWANQPFVAASQVDAIGWSLGGGGVLAALGRIAPGGAGPLRAVVAYTPVCDAITPWRVKVPALVLMGADDRIARPVWCQQLIARLPPGTPLVARVYPHAGHGFDRPGPGYDDAAAHAAMRDVERFLQR